MKQGLTGIFGQPLFPEIRSIYSAFSLPIYLVLTTEEERTIV